MLLKLETLKVILICSTSTSTSILQDITSILQDITSILQDITSILQVYYKIFYIFLQLNVERF